MKYNFFIVNNSETLKSLDDIVLVEKGPYVYNEYRNKQNITYEDNDNRVSYRENKTYVFNKELSGKGLDENDEFDFINFPNLVYFVKIIELNK